MRTRVMMMVFALAALAGQGAYANNLLLLAESNMDVFERTGPDKSGEKITGTVKVELWGTQRVDSMDKPVKEIRVTSVGKEFPFTGVHEVTGSGLYQQGPDRMQIYNTRSPQGKKVDFRLFPDSDWQLGAQYFGAWVWVMIPNDDIVLRARNVTYYMVGFEGFPAEVPAVPKPIRSIFFRSMENLGEPCNLALKGSLSLLADDNRYFQLEATVEDPTKCEPTVKWKEGFVLSSSQWHDSQIDMRAIGAEGSIFHLTAQRLAEKTEITLKVHERQHAELRKTLFKMDPENE